MGTSDQSQGAKPPLEYLRDLANQSSWEGFAAQISVRSGERLSAVTLWRAASAGWEGFKNLRLSVGQFNAITQLTGLSFDELYKLSQGPKAKNSHSEENESHQSI